MSCWACQISMSLPPALALGVFYEGVLQSALRQFFRRATLEVEPSRATPSDAPLTIEPSSIRPRSVISWCGTGYTLRMPGRGTFTPHQIRMLRAIVAVVGARYNAILNPEHAADRGELFRGPLEDRYVGAFFDERPYLTDSGERRVDRIASIIELLRVAALSSYENRPISTGVLLARRRPRPVPARSVREHRARLVIRESLASIKSFFRLADGVRTMFLADAEGRLLDIIDIDRWSRQLCPDAILDVPGAEAYQAACTRDARATQCLRRAEPVARDQGLRRRRGGLHVPRRRLAPPRPARRSTRCGRRRSATTRWPLRLFQTALDLADAREGALFVVAARPGRAVRHAWWRPRIGSMSAIPPRCRDPVSSRAAISSPARGTHAPPISIPACSSTLASLDGAIVVDRDGRLLAAGAILRHPPSRRS